jgi:hypothetical protein
MPQRPTLERVLLNRNKITPAEQEVRDILNSSDIDPTSGVAPTAPQFRKQPEVWSTDPKVLSAVDRTMHVSPEIAGNISRIETGPSGHLISTILSDPHGEQYLDKWNSLNLVGLFTPKDKRMWIRPEDGFQSRHAETLGHEAAHSRGYVRHGTETFKELEDALHRAYNPPMNHTNYKQLPTNKKK